VTARPRTVAATRSKVTAPARRRETGTQRVRSQAVQRAYARRAQRTATPHGGARSVDPHNLDPHRAPFVLLMMGLLAVALVATLWLSTAAAADSYHLQSAQERARNLTERSENLSREVANLETAPELARRARELGMVPAGDPAQLVVRPDGAVVLIGQPRRATAPPPLAPAPAAAPAPAEPPPPAPAEQPPPAPAEQPPPAPAQPPAPAPAAPAPPGGT
jgi:cell division protein FtsI (penicillin-binding protein 3)